MVATRRSTLGPVNRNRRVSMSVTDTKAKEDVVFHKKKTSKKRMTMVPRIAGGNTEGSLIKPQSQPLPTTSPARIPGSAQTNCRQPFPTTPGRNRRQTLAASRNDPRPMSDKAYFNTCIRGLMSYLVSNDYEHPVKLKDLSRPSAKDFHNMVTFLLRRINVNFRDGTGNFKFEDEVSVAFKALGYPFNISKTALVAAGSPHTWPTLLMALTWLVELLECTEGGSRLGEGGREEDDTYQIDDIGEGMTSGSITEETGQVLDNIEKIEAQTKKVLNRYLGEAYPSFMAEDDEHYEKLELGLVEYCERDNMKIERDIEKTTEDNAAIIEAINTLGKKVEDFPQHYTRREELATDLEKFHDLVEKLKEHKAALSEKIRERTISLKKRENSIGLKNDRIQDLRKIVKTQELSVDDVRVLDEERSRLYRSNEQVMVEKEDHLRKIEQIDSEMKEGMERLEKTLEVYNLKVLEVKPGSVGDGDDDSDKYIVQIHKDIEHDEQIQLVGGMKTQSGSVTQSLLPVRREFSENAARLRCDLLELIDELEMNEGSLIDVKENVEVLAARKKIIEDDMWEEKDNQKIELATKLKKTQAVEEKVEVLVDPSALEEALARYRARCVELKTLKHKICKENATEKQAVLEEMNEFFKMYKEHEQYKIEKLNKLEKDVKSYDPLAIRLDQNDEDFISNL